MKTKRSSTKMIFFFLLCCVVVFHCFHFFPITFGFVFFCHSNLSTIRSPCAVCRNNWVRPWNDVTKETNFLPYGEVFPHVLQPPSCSRMAMPTRPCSCFLYYSIVLLLQPAQPNTRRVGVEVDKRDLLLSLTPQKLSRTLR